MKLSKYIDHTKLGAVVVREQIDKLIIEALQYDFKSVCVNPIWVKYAKEKLKDSDVLVCTVIGFPHGSILKEVKGFETKMAIRDGADEIDMVINIGALVSHNDDLILEEIKEVVSNASKKTVKVIIETCYLSEDDIKRVCDIARKAGADFVKTSTGFGSRGASLNDVELMKKCVKNDLEVKASGGIRTYDDAIKMIEKGATRIGTSNGVDIVNKEEKNNGNTAY